MCSVWTRACIDSAPCSPSRPNPTCNYFAQGIIWSSNRCIFRSSEVSHELWYCSGLVEASLFRTLDAIFTSTLVGRVLHSCVSKSPALTSLLHLTHFTIMSFNIKGGAGLICCGYIGDSMKQQGHFTSLQLKSRKQCTKQSVQTVLYMIAPEVDTVYITR